MNRDKIEGNWTIFKGKVREKWGELTDDEVEELRGKEDQLIGRIQERYGETREQVEREIDDLMQRL